MKWTEEEIQILREKYPGNGSNIGELDRTKNSIRLKASELGIKCNYPYNRKEANRNFFSNIDSEKKAYWLGFILADGNIDDKANTNPQMRIRINKRDKRHLKKFKNHIESEHTISEGDNGAVCIVIGGGDICKDLKNHGITPRKTGKEDPSKVNAPDHLKNHFWRGMVDGDGGVYIGNSGNYKKVAIRLYGTKKTCEEFRNYIINQIGIDTKASVHKNTSGYRFEAGGSELPMKVIKHLYGESSVSLDRKQKMANAVIEGDWRET